MQRLDLRPLLKTALAVAAALMLTASSAHAALVNLTPTGGALNSTTSVTLDSLQNGTNMGIVVGDKIFTGFSYSKIGDMPDPTAINVLGFHDPDGNWGVSFHGTFLDLPGDATGSDALIRFMVQVSQTIPGTDGTPNPARITDAHLFLGGVGAGDESFFTVDESFLGRNETLHTFYSTLGAGPTQQQLSDQTLITPSTTKLNVTKDIFALAAQGGFLPARATVIDQSFSQTVPEPATLVLAALSMVGLVAAGRKTV
jgi:hypothetical protein